MNEVFLIIKVVVVIVMVIPAVIALRNRKKG
jgi:hypothetical protein